jgi:hypothetical protein
MDRRLRRPLAAALIVLGALLMFLAPPVWIGAIPLGLGIVLELIGISLEHRSRT